MAGLENENGKSYYKCAACNTRPLESIGYISHIQSKRHLKNLKDRSRPQPNDEHNRTLQVTGIAKNVPLEGIINVFLKYGVRLVSRTHNAITIEFHSSEGAVKALENDNYWKDTVLQVSPVKYNKHNAGRRSVPIGPRMWSRLRGRASGFNLKRLIYDLIAEIEIKRQEYEKREYLRKIMVRFLMPHFNRVHAYIFGSSANNLGFTGCDVDLYADLGVNPWDSGYSRAEAQAHASDLTWYLARQIRSTRRGVQVQAVPRARVPIVKFRETTTGLQVDLSFRHNMPVYNTNLIYQYTMTHELVRPYMMLIRCWAKIQDVAGGGEPSFLITNYALCLMMLFYLMYRDDPIVPSVTYLRQDSRNHSVLPYIVAGWDCSFSNNVAEWTNRYHNISIMELVAEFFEFYSKLDASKWIVSPYAGTLIEKSKIKDRDTRKLPQCMLSYCQQDTDIQINTALCVQDAFELSHNCTRGLKRGPLAEFQYKCSVAAQISRAVVEGTQSLSDFLEVIEMTPAALEDLFQAAEADEGNGAVEEVNSKRERVEQLQEIITLDDSQDSIIELDSVEEVQIVQPFKGDENFIGLDVKNDDGPTKSQGLGAPLGKCSKFDRPLIMNNKADGDTVEMIQINSPLSKPSRSGDYLSLNVQENEVLTKRKKSDKFSTDNCNSDVEILTDTDAEITVIGESNASPVRHTALNTTANGVTGSDSDTGSHPREFLDREPGERPLKCIFLFKDIPEFTINFDGAVSGSKNVMTLQDDIGQAACSLINFALQQCLKIEVSVIEDFLGCKKRKTLEMENDTDSSKRLKAENGECIPVQTKYRKLAQYKCTAEVHLWIGRKKITKTVPRQANTTPLQHELAITEVQMESRGNLGSGLSIDCQIEVWQKCDNASYIVLTGRSLSEEKHIKGHLIQMFNYLASFIQNLLKKVVVYVQATSSKR